MKASNSIKWGMVTFSLGITCGVLGHYLPDLLAICSVILISVVFGLFGSAAVEFE